MNKEYNNIEILGFHGWGFDAGFWEELRSVIPETISFTAANRGYFQSPNVPSFSAENTLKVVMAHSFGLSWCPAELTMQADLLILFNSFQSFHPENNKEAIRSKKVLDAMINGFQKKPEVILEQFWKNTYEPSGLYYHPNTTPEQELLLEDLKKLHHWQFESSNLAKGLPIICLDGKQDQILKTPRGKAFTRIPNGDRIYHILQEAGHGLPTTHSLDCWSFISSMIAIFEDNGNYRR